ncbi:hypothetical protein Hanom_Chr10g00930961 [Helianthus anomalus]
MALSLRSVRSIPGHSGKGSVTDRIRIRLRSVRHGCGPYPFWLTVRKAVAGSRFWTTVCSACYTDLNGWFSK